MQGKTQSKLIALSALALLGFAATGCSTSGTQAVDTAQPEPTEYTGLVIYDDSSPQMYALVATDSIGFIAFADTMLAWSDDAPSQAQRGRVVIVE